MLSNLYIAHKVASSIKLVKNLAEVMLHDLDSLVIRRNSIPDESEGKWILVKNVNSAFGYTHKNRLGHVEPSRSTANDGEPELVVVVLDLSLRPNLLNELRVVVRRGVK